MPHIEPDEEELPKVLQSEHDYLRATLQAPLYHAPTGDLNWCNGSTILPQVWPSIEAEDGQIVPQIDGSLPSPEEVGTLFRSDSPNGDLIQEHLGISPPKQSDATQPETKNPYPSPLASPAETRANDIARRISGSRRPSELLRQCERTATSRQRHLMGGNTVDRFISSRSSSRKNVLHYSHPKLSLGHVEDPFGPSSRRKVERYGTIRTPPSTPRSVPPPMRIGQPSRVRESQQTPTRAASTGSIWTVGGTVVTEGVASTTNGRGGRVTSGTGASHYTADFLHRNTPSEEEVTHGQRLALAMDLNHTSRVLDHTLSPPSSPSSPLSEDGSPGRVWKDGIWEKDGIPTSTKPKKKKDKDVPIIPFRVLDAPALRDDYYCSLLAYSRSIQCLAVGLGPHVYLWSENRGTKNIPDSLTAPYGSSHVTCVSFSSTEGGSAILAIGRADGRITLWSPLDRDPRFDSEQPAPVSCVCFRPNTIRRPSLREPTAMVATEELLVGDEVGYVYFYSIEWPTQDQRDLFDWHGSMTLLARITCHSQQVCGIAWSPDGEFFATGGNDNQLFLFESKKILRRAAHCCNESSPTVRVRDGSSCSSTTLTGQPEVLTILPGQQKHVFALNAAVKAIAFAPWQSSLLAAGGGSNDRCIHFFHTLSGANLATIECHAQVTSLVWSEKRKEIASTFGFAQPEHPYRVAVFTWPSCNMVVRIPWYGEERALFAVSYPRGPRGAQTQQGSRAKSSRDAVTDKARQDAEGRPWYGKRTKEEGCLVVATSDASIKFHEVWAESRSNGGKKIPSGVLGGCQILEEECTGDIERWTVIR